MRFTCCPNLMFLPYPWLETHFADLKQFKIDSHFATLGKSKLTLFVYFNEFGQVTIVLLGLGKTGGKNNPNPHKKFKNHAWNLAQVIFNDLISMNQELGSQLINKLQRSNLLFLFVTYLCDKENMLDNNQDTKSFITEEISFKWLLFFWQYCQEPYLKLTQKSLVEVFCKNS